MAGRGWGGSVATAVGVAAGVGAAQLGFGYGLGIVNWTPVDATATEAAWFASLAWATWIAAVSAVLGAVCAQRLHERGGQPEPGGTLHRVTLAVAGAVGALITVLLVAVPARAATVPETFSPQTVAAGYAGIGVLVGLVAAVWALHSRAVAVNVVATVGWLWLLAVVSVVDGVLAGRGLTSAQLGIWQIAHDSVRFWVRDYLYWPGALLATGSALMIGALAARRTARLAERRLGAAISGAAGPLLVAVAYFLAVPRLATIAPAQVSAHLIAPYAVIVGVAGSALVAALAQRAERRAAARGAVTVPRQRTGAPDDLPTSADPLPADDRTPVGAAARRTGAVTEVAAGSAATFDPATGGAAVTVGDPAVADAPSASAGSRDAAPPSGAAGRARPPRRGRAAASPKPAEPAASRKPAAAGPGVEPAVTDEPVTGPAPEPGPPASGTRRPR
ncbi:hypothetical protein [Micromonospora sp. CPCC 205556]|uniref:hypothetical protein n=1 Tax=Micromonospora sp. CPCC 205556 TaxID=3122398 RepID=UPI002FF39725